MKYGIYSVVLVLVIAPLCAWLFPPVYAISGISLLSSILLLLVAKLSIPKDESLEQDQQAEQISSTAMTIEQQSSHIAIGGASVSYFIDKLSQFFNEQVDSTKEIANRVSNLEEANTKVIALSEEVTSNITHSEKEAMQSIEVLDEVSNQQKGLESQIANTTSLLHELRDNASAIGNIVDTINQLAEQTNMLALNAAIEAARAGEQGRGFAVVADEVRNLAKRTTEATSGIEDVLNQITQKTHDSVSAITQVSESGNRMSDLVQQTSAKLDESRQSVHSAQISMETLNGSIENAKTDSSGISLIARNLFESIESHTSNLKDVSNKAFDIAVQTESIFRAVSVFEIETKHQLVQRIAINASKEIGNILEKAISDGKLTSQQVFDTQYKQIENTNPPKYSTKYDSYSDSHFPLIQEPILNNNNFIIYAGAVDINGYFPTHNKCFSKPLTGNYEQDLLHSRTKRIFDDATGARCGKNKELFLLQTYKRDTGEIMHDLSAPIFVNGKHWGGFRIGYTAEG